MSTEADSGVKKRKDSTPPDGYVCRLCSVPGHWIQVCPTKKTGSKKRKASDHVPIAGQDPSPEDIERAKELQAIPPPKCFCGLPSRLNKVKRSKVQEGSRAIGKYFFFCSKKRDDETQCRFARPVDMELKKNKKIDSRMKAKKKEGVVSKAAREDKTSTTKTKQVCKFFAKTGSCKKGDKCEFSHEKGGDNVKKAAAPVKTQKKVTPSADEETKDESDKSSSGSSSSDSSSNSSSDSSSDSDDDNDNGVGASTTNVKEDDSDDSDSSSSDESE